MATEQIHEGQVRMGHILVSPLNWGLGHATRDIPVIRSLLAHGHDVTIAACGNALATLQQEFPACTCREFPDYSVPFSANRFFLAHFVASFPTLFRGITDEHRNLAALLAEDEFDLIISDNRFGIYAEKVPSLFITHQLRYHLPPVARPLELAGVHLNSFLHANYDRIIVPDNPPGPSSLAGKLSRAETGTSRNRAYYAGILTSTRRRDVAADLDYLILISGPEPQRTGLEKILLPAAGDLPGSVAVLLGSPERSGDDTVISGRCTVIPYASTEEKELLMNRAKCIICRSGYTTMMELAELGKRRALLIPTPGQTEQEYLAGYYEKNGWFHARAQHRLDLDADLRLTEQFHGFPDMPGTEENVERLYNNVLAEYLE
ncbi:glycosyltransferase [Methanoregula sp.]|uniref:glycosyltransferase n=1 Tax=Methanoregula sp. TaxID=2052170 RepID=UPI003C248ADB